MSNQVIFFTADHHFGHKNIISHCRRPFITVEEMDRELINRWNERVEKNDIVYYLGDFSLKKDISEYLNQLSGTILFLDNRSHHDFWQRKFKDFLPPIYQLKINHYDLILSHFPLLEWNKKHYGSIHLHGHSHGNLLYHERAVDVGVDCWDFYPVTLDEILERRFLK